MGRPPRPARCPKHQREALGPLALRRDARVRLGPWLPPRAPGTGDRPQRRAPRGRQAGRPVCQWLDTAATLTPLCSAVSADLCSLPQETSAQAKPGPLPS